MLTENQALIYKVLYLICISGKLGEENKSQSSSDLAKWPKRWSWNSNPSLTRSKFMFFSVYKTIPKHTTQYSIKVYIGSS
jgi:hypothetical protein